VVINLRGDVSHDASTIFANIRERFRNWLAHKRKKDSRIPPPMGVHTFENPDGHMHVNWVVHVPPGHEREFERKARRWVERAHGASEPFDVVIKPITHTPKSLAKYILKGTDPRFVDHFFLGEVAAPQGEVWGRRAGISQAVGIRARKKAGFKPRRGRRYQPPAITAPAGHAPAPAGA
jgi:hypothetical protein